MYLKLKITGNQALHGRLPGEDFFVRADDATGKPINTMWAKRLAEEEQHHSGFVSVLEHMGILPNGERAIDETPAALPPMGARPPLPSSQDMENRVMDAVARALAGIRSEIARLPVTTGTPDLKPLMDHIKIEVERAAQRCAQFVMDERQHTALVADAWRVRMTLPPAWKTGDPVTVQPPPLIDAYAVRNHSGDVGAAAMELTEADLKWQQDQADAMRSAVMLQPFTRAA